MNIWKVAWRLYTIREKGWNHMSQVNVRYHHCLRKPERNSPNGNLVFFTYLQLFYFAFCMQMLEVLQGLAKHVWVQTCAQTRAHKLTAPTPIICLLLPWYFDFPHFDFHCCTFECEHPGGAFFYVLCYSEFPSAFTWLVVVKIMPGAWDLTQCREDVEFCQPGKYVWLFFFFFSLQQLSYAPLLVWSH